LKPKEQTRQNNEVKAELRQRGASPLNRLAKCPFLLLAGAHRHFCAAVFPLPFSFCCNLAVLSKPG